MPRPRFDSDALEAVRQAVARAEQRTAGEIVTYIVGESDSYPEAAWTGAALGALAALLVGISAHSLWAPWDPSLLAWDLLPAATGAALGYLSCARLPWLKRLILSPATMDRRCGLRAESAFLEEEVFHTRDRSGILIFLSLFERRAAVLGDSGINRAVGPEEWEGLVRELVDGMRAGDATGALVRAVEHAGGILERHGVEIRPDDVDELDNAPRVRDS